MSGVQPGGPDQLAAILIAVAFLVLYLVWKTGLIPVNRRRRPSSPKIKPDGDAPQPDAGPGTSPAQPLSGCEELELVSFSGKVWVHDGDTITVSKTCIRLFGMDAPELGQRGGGGAKLHLIRLVEGQRVRIEPLTIDVYGRTVAKVWLGEIDLSRQMVVDGYAVAMTNWHVDYVQDEREARRERRGLWKNDPVTGITDPAAHRRWTKRRRH